MEQLEKRPALTSNISLEDFRDFYWLKEELIAFCRVEGLSTQGGKIQVASRIERFLQNGRKHNTLPQKDAPISNFDWNHADLTLATIITDNYKNTENVRAFFQEQLGKTFKFNVTFMDWMKQNSGKTLGDAVTEWKRIKIEKTRITERKKIAPQFEYNRYVRDFLEDNPDKSRADAIQFWKIKRSLRGDNLYKKSDLSMLPQAINHNRNS